MENEVYVSQRAFGRQVGLSHVRVGQLIKEGKLKTNEDGKIPLNASLKIVLGEEELVKKQEKIEQYLEKTGGIEGQLTEDLLKMTDSDPNTAFAILRAKELYYKTLQKQLEVDKANGTLISLDDTKAAFKQIAIDVKQELLSIPQRLAVRLENRNAREIEDLLEDAINGALEKLQTTAFS